MTDVRLIDADDDVNLDVDVGFDVDVEFCFVTGITTTVDGGSGGDGGNGGQQQLPVTLQYTR
jgi:hypothetical protein